jgi:hypothetical protein
MLSSKITLILFSYVGQCGIKCREMDVWKVTYALTDFVKGFQSLSAAAPDIQCRSLLEVEGNSGSQAHLAKTIMFAYVVHLLWTI